MAAANTLFWRVRDKSGLRSTGEVAVEPKLEFDATITLHAHLRYAGLDDDRAAEAVLAVRTAVRSMRGARMISVEYVGPWVDGWDWLRRAEWVTVYRAWEAVLPGGLEWERLRESVEETVRMALAEVADR